MSPRRRMACREPRRLSPSLPPTPELRLDHRSGVWSRYASQVEQLCVCLASLVFAWTHVNTPWAGRGPPGIGSPWWVGAGSLTTAEVLPQRTIASWFSWVLCRLPVLSREPLVGCECQAIGRCDSAACVVCLYSQRAAVPEWPHRRCEGGPHRHRASDGLRRGALSGCMGSEAPKPHGMASGPGATRGWEIDRKQKRKNKGDGLPPCTLDQMETRFDEPLCDVLENFSERQCATREEHGMGA